MSAPQDACCPECGRKGLRVLTWRELGIDETSLMCWDCSWITYPPGVNEFNWRRLMDEHIRLPGAGYATPYFSPTETRMIGMTAQYRTVWRNPEGPPFLMQINRETTRELQPIRYADFMVLPHPHLTFSELMNHE